MEQKVISNFLKTFRLALNYLKIYPPTSQMVETAINAFYKLINDITKQKDSITISDFSGKLIVEGNELQSPEDLMASLEIIKILNQKEIKSITFKSGITKDELYNFITSILKKNKNEIQQYPNIILDQTTYVAIVKGEEAVVKIDKMINNSNNNIVDLIKSIRESYDLIDQIEDPNMRQHLQKHLAQELAKQDTYLLREIFDRELPLKIEKSGLKQYLLNSLSQEKIKEIFEEIVQWYDEIKKQKSSDFDAIDQLDKLKSFIQKILKAPAATHIPKQFFEDLIQKGLLSELPEWFSPQMKKPNILEEFKYIIEKSATDLLDKDIRDNLPQIVNKLCEMEYNEELTKLIEKLLINMSNSATKIRLLAIQTITTIYEILKTYNKEQILRYLEPTLLEAIKNETSTEISFYICELLRLRAKQNILYGEMEIAIRIIDALKQKTIPDIVDNKQIRDNAQKSLSYLISEIIDILISDLRIDNEKKRQTSMQILAKLGKDAIVPLIKVIKTSDDLRNRYLAASILKNIGEQSYIYIKEELGLNLSTEELKRFIEILNLFDELDIVEKISQFLSYPDVEVKKYTLRYLAKINSKQAKTLIIESLKDKDLSVVNEVVHLLEDLRYNESVPILIKLLNSQQTPLDLQEEICIVLGYIGNPMAVDVLIRKLNSKPFLFVRKNNELDRVRMRAAWALRKFSGHKVIQALEKATKDSVSLVSMTAKESLRFVNK